MMFRCCVDSTAKVLTLTEFKEGLTINRILVTKVACTVCTYVQVWGTFAFQNVYNNFNQDWRVSTELIILL